MIPKREEVSPSIMSEISCIKGRGKIKIRFSAVENRKICHIKVYYKKLCFKEATS